MGEARGGSGPGTDFIRQTVAADIDSGRYGGRVVTRFPPEPNGFLHVGHATAICLNFGIADEFGGRCHLRYDDTNPEKENEEYALAIQEDIRWLGFDWGEHLYYASDYFERMYECAETLIRKGLAYVDSRPLEEIREGRGSVTEPGVDSPYRERGVEENLDLFRRMRGGEFEDGTHVLRARIDMASPNMLMRDPVLYRIRHAAHYRQGDAWCIYPLYDYAHCLEDAFEEVTHSICTIEFENNRELYDWVLESVGFEEPRPHQYEWAGLDLEHAVLSKRAIAPLVEAGIVSGWDDPRLATISGLRRRGIPPEAIRLLAKLVGVSRADARTEVSKLDYAIREVLNPTAPRVMAVLDPLKVVLTNYPEGESDRFDAPYFPPDVGREGSRSVPFSREVWIERADFAEDPPKGFRRLVPGGEVRLRYAYVIRCQEVLKDDDGRVIELHCTFDPDTRGGSTPEGRKVQGTIQWVSVDHGLDTEVHLFGPLFADGDAGGQGRPDDDVEGEEGSGAEVAGGLQRVNPDSVVVLDMAKIEPSVASDPPSTRYQFERTGYFWRDPVDATGDLLVFNRIVPLKDTYRPKGGAGERDGASGGISAGRQGPPLKPAPRSLPDTAPSPAKPRVSERRSAAREADPELARRFDRYQTDHALAVEFADVLTDSLETSDFFEDALSAHPDPETLAVWIVGDLRGLVGDGGISSLSFGGAALGRLQGLVADGSVSRRAAKDVLAGMVESGGEPADLVESMGLSRVTDAADLGAAVDRVLANWPAKVDEYRAGRTKLIGLFVGEVMKDTGGAADPKAARTLLIERLGS